MKRYGILDRVKSSSDLRDLSYVSLDELCGALREFIIDHVSKTAGIWLPILALLNSQSLWSENSILRKIALFMMWGISVMYIKF